MAWFSEISKVRKLLSIKCNKDISLSHTCCCITRKLLTYTMSHPLRASYRFIYFLFELFSNFSCIRIYDRNIKQMCHYMFQQSTNTFIATRYFYSICKFVKRNEYLKFILLNFLVNNLAWVDVQFYVPLWIVYLRPTL